ncbi:MAG: hypothetical protein CMJ83_00040 [Planctomycetes bacterium]|nr:hypothetical protein [Planctomycetota bacterium]
MNALLLTTLSMLTGPPPVEVENPSRFHLVLFQVVDDESRPLKTLGDGARHRLKLAHGHHWIDARSGTTRVRLPVPLPRRARLPDVLRLKVVAPPRLVLPIQTTADDWGWVPAGPALRGDVIGVGQEDERPARVENVSGFWIRRREITNADYCGFLNGQPKVDPTWINLDSRKVDIRRDATKDRWVTGSPRLPVVTVSWFGADAYCKWRTRITKRTHRLPTETEWEKAARGPESFVYGYGNIYRNAGANQESGRLRIVGTFSANGFGLYDVTGNAYEWVQNVFDRDALRHAVPRRLAALDDEGIPRHRVLRGGSFVLDGMYLRNSFRMCHRPGVQADDFGFRVVMEEGIAK